MPALAASFGREPVITGEGDAFCTGIDRSEAVSEDNNAAMARGDYPDYPTPWMYDDPGRDIGPKTLSGYKQPAIRRLLQQFPQPVELPVDAPAGSPADVPEQAAGDRADDRLVLRQIIDEVMFEIRELTGQDYVDEYATKKAESFPSAAPSHVTALEQVHGNGQEAPSPRRSSARARDRLRSSQAGRIRPTAPRISTAPRVLTKPRLKSRLVVHCSCVYVPS